MVFDFRTTLQTFSTRSNIFHDSMDTLSIMQSVVIILFLIVAYVVSLRILADISSDVYRPSLSPKQLWIVIPSNRDEAIPVVPVSCTFDYNQPIHLYSFIVMETDSSLFMCGFPLVYVLLFVDF